jgi:hypothetical protein
MMTGAEMIARMREERKRSWDGNMQKGKYLGLDGCGLDSSDGAGGGSCVHCDGPRIPLRAGKCGNFVAQMGQS